jgi:uncharacterized protein
MNISHFERARQYALQRLERELSPNLHYHAAMHTRDEVVPITEKLAIMEGLNEETLYLLLTAAWFHDLGYVEKHTHHELISTKIAMQVLPDFGYSSQEIEIVRWAILATVLPQSPSTLLEQILTDADLDVLGREDFMVRNNDLRKEFAYFGREYTDVEWCKNQIKFIEAHQYFTASARNLRDAGKLSNIANLKQKLEALES